MTLRQMKTLNNAIKAAWSAGRCAKQLRWPNSWLSLNLCQHRAVVAVALVAPGVAVGQISAPEAAQMSAWVRTTGDHAGQPFAIIDKRNARLFIFDENAVLRGASPVLLGLASGDDSVPGIGERKIADIRPEERTTPAGRFQSEPGRNIAGEDIVWIDYDAAVSLHRVRNGKAADRRLERLKTPTSLDNRISYGCVNVPTQFYDAWIKPSLGTKPGVIYVIPETRSLASLLHTLKTR